MNTFEGAPFVPQFTDGLKKLTAGVACSAVALLGSWVALGPFHARLSEGENAVAKYSAKLDSKFPNCNSVLSSDEFRALSYDDGRTLLVKSGKCGDKNSADDVAAITYANHNALNESQVSLIADEIILGASALALVGFSIGVTVNIGRQRKDNNRYNVTRYSKMKDMRPAVSISEPDEEPDEAQTPSDSSVNVDPHPEDGQASRTKTIAQTIITPGAKVRYADTFPGKVVEVYVHTPRRWTGYHSLRAAGIVGPLRLVRN